MARTKAVKLKTQLSEPQIERIACMSEENGETVQALGKILRHGYESHNPDGSVYKDNRDLLQDEVGDVLASIIVMVKAGDIDPKAINERIGVKLQKYSQYLHCEENKQIVKSLLENQYPALIGKD